MPTCLQMPKVPASDRRTNPLPSFEEAKRMDEARQFGPSFLSEEDRRRAEREFNDTIERVVLQLATKDEDELVSIIVDEEIFEINPIVRMIALEALKAKKAQKEKGKI